MTAADGALTHRRVLKIALPIVLSNATVPILGAVDTGVVGQLGQAAPIGAVGIGAIILATIYWVFGFLRMGTTGLVAQARGAGDRQAWRWQRAGDYAGVQQADVRAADVTAAYSGGDKGRVRWSRSRSGAASGL